MLTQAAKVYAQVAKDYAEVKAVAQKAGGNGGGKPDMAMAGAKQPEKIEEALDSVKETVYAMLK